MKFFGKSIHGEEKTDQLLRLLKENNNENKWITKFCFRELEIFRMSRNERISLVEFLKEQSDVC